MAGLANARPKSRGRAKWVAWVALLVTACVVGGAIAAPPAFAQQGMLSFPQRPAGSSRTIDVTRRGGERQPMLVQANELQYDYSNKRVRAVGNVQIYHDGATLEADRVIYDEAAKRLHAEGNVRLTERDGRITYGEIMNLSEDFRDGFVDSLRLDSPDQTRMAATRADRSGGNFTVFQSGVYTACEPCKEDPRRPPLWQVSAARIIHDEGERMVYFENARLEFFGKPVAYMPYFAAPDPTVKRKTGFLMPLTSYSGKYGLGVQVPYYWALSPTNDFTFSPLITTRQGPLVEGEYRQRLINGAFAIRAAGIYQLDKDYFKRTDGTPTPGYRDFRGSIEANGQFSLNEKWVWGFNGLLVTDRTFFQDYNVTGHRNFIDPFRTGSTEGVSQFYVAGKGSRSYFDTRAIYYYGFSEADVQSQIPVIHPVLDYNYVFEQPIMGGEVGYNVNLTSLSRRQAEFDPISTTALANGFCNLTTANPAVKVRNNCLLRGVPGDYTRFSADASWKRTITDPLGQMFTPFLMLRGDVYTYSIDPQPGVSNYIATGDRSDVRAMPTAGVEYRYPFINVQSWGTQTVEPIAQVIVRPNEQRIGKLPNEDAQSLIFDDGNLFRVDKFSGYDRVEGGGRANVGVQYNMQFNRGGFINALFGQSYQMFGTNSFSVADATNTGLGSGLDKSRSDYVARLAYQPDRIYTFTTRYRFQEETFELKRFELEGRANYDRWSVAMLYGNYAEQPELGFLTRREGILGQTSYKINANWVATAAARYDIDASKFDQTQFGLGYIDDCFLLGVNYITSYTYSGNPKADHRVMVYLALRTLGGTQFSQNVGTVGQ